MAFSGLVLNAQNSITDSLEVALSSHQTVDTVLVKILNDLSFQYLNSDRGKGLDMVNKSIRLSDSLEYKEGKIWALVNKGNALWLSGLYDEAMVWFYRANALNGPRQNFARMAIANNIAEVFKKKQQADSALVYYRTCWQIVIENDLSEPKPLLAYNIGELFQMMGKADSSTKYYEIAYQEALKSRNERYLGYALFGKGELAMGVGDTALALMYLQQSLNTRRKIEDIPGTIQSLHRLSQMKIASNEYQDAAELLIESGQLSRQIDGLDYLSDTYLQQSMLYEAQGKYSLANQYMKLHYNLKDSLESQSFLTRSEQIQEALLSEIRFKEYQLSEQQRLGQEQDIRLQTWIIAFISFLMLVLFAYFFNYRRGLRIAQRQSKALNDLNGVILSKNREIEEINKKLDHKLISVTKLLSESQKIAKLGSWEYNCITKEYQWTDETYRQLGLAPQSAKPSNELLRERVPPEDYARLTEALKRTRTKGVISSEHFRLHLSTGEEKFIRIKYFPEIIKGRLVRVYGSNQDITEAILTEQGEKAVIRSLLELSRFANLNRYDFKHFVDYLLKQAAQILNVDRASFWLYKGESKQLVCFKSYCLESKSTSQIETITLSDFPAYLSAIMDHRTLPVSDAGSDTATSGLHKKVLSRYDLNSLLDAKVQIDGEMVGLFSVGDSVQKEWSFSDQRYVGSLTDIIATAYSTSQNQKLEIEKGELINKLFKKSQNLEELAYVVSHNLRGPVTQIMGLAELYSDPQSQGLEKDIIRRIAESSKELDKVIKDLSEILKQQEEETELIEELSFKKTVHEILAQVRTEWPKIDYKLNLSVEEGFVIQGKRSQINNIVYTLLSNSFKYRQPDRRLDLNVTAKRSTYAIQLSFADNGLGIDLAKYESKIFRMYQRFHPEINGTGIGLFIVKNQVEAMGGSIEVTSHLLEGTIFTVELPLSAPRSVTVLKMEKAI